MVELISISLSLIHIYARNLKSVEVKGSQPNEELTAFRLENKDKGLSGTREAAAAFIAQSPSSPVSVFLFKEYFLSYDDVSQGDVKKHYRALCKACLLYTSGLPLGWRDL